MTRRVLLVLGALWLAATLLAASGWRGSASAAESDSLTVHISSAAWYLELPPCAGLLDCSPLPPLNAYPENTLHVAVLAGLETASTDLAFAFTLPAGAELTAGTLTLPIDSAPADGSLRPETANMVACLVTGSVEAVRGSLAHPPEADCGVSAPATWDAKQQAFSVNLASFVSHWQGGTGAVALMPASEPPSPDLWHVVFYASTEDSEAAPPITATLRYTISDTSGPALPPQVATGGPGFTGGVGFGPFPQPSTPAPAPLPTQPVVQPLYPGGFAGPGFAYPIIWALPLVILAGIGAVGRALTKELYRRGV